MGTERERDSRSPGGEGEGGSVRHNKPFYFMFALQRSLRVSSSSAAPPRRRAGGIEEKEGGKGGLCCGGGRDVLRLRASPLFANKVLSAGGGREAGWLAGWKICSGMSKQVLPKVGDGGVKTSAGQGCVINSYRARFGQNTKKRNFGFLKCAININPRLYLALVLAHS